MSEKEIISRKDFLNMPKGRTENKVLDFFKLNPNQAFKEKYIGKFMGLQKSAIYPVLNNLIKVNLIEKRGEYFCLKDEKEISEEKE